MFVQQCNNSLVKVIQRLHIVQLAINKAGKSYLDPRFKKLFSRNLTFYLFSFKIHYSALWYNREKVLTFWVTYFQKGTIISSHSLPKHKYSFFLFSYYVACSPLIILAFFFKATSIHLNSSQCVVPSI